MNRLLPCLGVALATWSHALDLPDGFTAETIATGLNAATALAVAPDGRIFLADQTGPLRVWKDGALLPAPALDLSDRVDTWWERGLIGLAFAPDFPRSPHLFVLYVAKAPFTHHVLSRFTLDGDTIDPASERILFEGDDQKPVGGAQPAGHQGGPIRFGPDGRLYVALGEQTSGRPAQSLAHLQGKILRLNPDGSIPADNPFHAETTGKHRAIWALGLRNPFGLAFEPGTGRLFATDVGQTSWEEVNVITRGANYGWPEAEGMSANPRFTNPLHTYPPAIGRCIVGGTFAPAAAGGAFPLPDTWRGRFFFADWSANWIKALDPARPGEVVTFARGLAGPVALEFAPDGSLLVLNRSTIWRDGKKWKPGTGSLVRIRFAGRAPGVDPGVAAAGRTLAATGHFARLAPLTPREGFVEFTVAHAPWQPGLAARRWISVPAGRRLGLNADGEFEFPAGTIVVQHYTVARTGAAFETQVFEFTGSGSGSRTARAAAFRWDEAGSGATRVEDGAVVALPGDPAHHWLSPGHEAELKLDTVVVGFVLPLSPRQLGAQQRHDWAARGWLPPEWTAPETVAWPPLAALDDPAASLEWRVRSYLDVNCALCHRPGGLARSKLDFRIATPALAARLAAAEITAGNLGLAGARLLAPGDPENSLLYQRVVHTDPSRMPAIAVNDDPQPVVPALAEWIRHLPRP
jgi:glucose/arabinose dehydrogenase